jgi:hypothetical protein
VTPCPACERYLARGGDSDERYRRAAREVELLADDFDADRDGPCVLALLGALSDLREEYVSAAAPHAVLRRLTALRDRALALNSPR